MRKILIAGLILLMSVATAFADVDSDILAAKNEIDAAISQVANEVADSQYPVGTIYISSRDITANQLSETVGGYWRPIEDTFLWAKGDDNVLNEVGGKREYIFTAGITQNDGGYSFATDDASTFVTDNPWGANVFMGVTAVSSEIIASFRTSSMEIMPPYTSVKMFERTYLPVPEISWTIQSGGYMEDDMLCVQDTAVLEISTNSTGELFVEGATLNGNLVTIKADETQVVTIGVNGNEDFEPARITIPVWRVEP